MTEAEKGKLISEGKTKKIWENSMAQGSVIVESKNDITAGDGAKHDTFPGKGRFSNQTACNVFRLLRNCGIPVAFTKQLSETEFIAPLCAMIEYEVVVRREAHGSCLKRYPLVRKGAVFPALVLEFFLKTKDMVWRGIKLPKDDPLVLFVDGKAKLFHPQQPMAEPFTILDDFPLSDNLDRIKAMGEIAKQVFLILEKAWQIQGRRLVDFKVEFGLRWGESVLADVIDNDSWRVLEGTAYIDKQVYRDGGNLQTVADNYRLVRDLTGRFLIPKQQVIIWRGSENDNVDELKNTIRSLSDNSVGIEIVTCSGHKKPVQSYLALQQAVQEVPDSVVIALIGMSNGAGPTLSANCTVPVITVPANAEKFPDDVWSSLRMPSQVPMMTVLSPKNAALAALQILAMRNPLLYSLLRKEQEKRLMNIIPF